MPDQLVLWTFDDGTYVAFDLDRIFLAIPVGIAAACLALLALKRFGSRKPTKKS